MKGYSTMKQFIQDYELYRTAERIDPGREGETVTSYLKKRISIRLASSKKSFNRQGYDLNDLRLIATHDTIKNFHGLEYFIMESYGTLDPGNVRKLLRSSAFSSGRLRRLYDFLPARIETKNELTRFIRTARAIGKGELAVIMDSICKKDWRKWIDELVEADKITQDQGRWLW